jgi:HEPN domain-containing protein
MTAKLPEIWLKYASDDLQSAEVLLKEGIYNMVCFHSQQAIEKLFKSFIATYYQEIPRIHNLIRLHKICEDLHGSQLNLDEEGLIFLNKVMVPCG